MAPLVVVPEWNPTTNNNKKLKESLEKLTSSTDAVILTLESNDDKKFLLQSKAYFDLKAYVMTGKDFPRSPSAFDSEITEDAFKALVGIDRDIYNETKKTFVSIGQTCFEFYDNTLYKLVKAGSTTKTWAKATLEILEPSAEINLYSELMVVSDLRYKTKHDEDDEFRRATSAIISQLDMLMKQAQDGKDEADELMTALRKFRDITDPLVPNVENLLYKYSKKHVSVEQSGSTREADGYLAYLRADYASAVFKLQNALSEYSQKRQDWRDAKDLAIDVACGFSWNFFGWIAIGILSADAEKIRLASNELWDAYKKLEKDEIAEATLIAYITKVVTHLENIKGKISAAIEAVGVLSLMFEEHKDSFEGIRSNFSTMHIGAVNEDAMNRKAFIDSSLRLAIEKLKTLNTASAGFVTAILTEDKDFLKKA